MNDEKLDSLFEEAFKVEYRKEFKEELKNMLLKEYDRRRKGRFYLRVSTAVAACLVLIIVLFLSFKLNMGPFKISNTSFMKNEIEQALNLNSNEETKIQEQDSVSEKQKEGVKSEAALQEDKTSKQSQEEKNPAGNLGKNSERVNKKEANGQKEFSQKQAKEQSASGEVGSIPQEDKSIKEASVSDSLKVKTNTIASAKTTEKSSKSSDKASKSSTPSKDVKNGSRGTDSKNESAKVVSATVPLDGKTNNSNEIQKSTMGGSNSSSSRSQKVFTSVYVLKEDKMEVNKDDIIMSLNAFVFNDVYKGFLAERVASSVYVSICQDYCYFEVANSQDLKFMSDIEENVEEKVYKEAESILNELGLKDYKILVVSQNNIYRADIVFYVQGYEVYDSQGYIEFDRFGNVKKGKIYLKKFLPIQKIEIYDIKTAAAEFKKRYNIKDLDVSRIKIVYKKQENVYIPHYIYVSENKIYWLEK